MKKLIGILFLFVLVHFSAAFPAFADPRMETNKNFCHFILDPNNTDNEIFVAGCDSAITVVEIIKSAESKTISCEENYVASGHSIVRRIMPAEAAPVSPRSSLIFTSDDSDCPCTMVESNGRAYKSYKWQSTIKAGELRQNGFVIVIYELFCQEGR